MRYPIVAAAVFLFILWIMMIVDVPPKIIEACMKHFVGIYTPHNGQVEATNYVVHEEHEHLLLIV